MSKVGDVCRLLTAAMGTPPANGGELAAQLEYATEIVRVVSAELEAEVERLRALSDRLDEWIETLAIDELRPEIDGNPILHKKIAGIV